MSTFEKRPHPKAIGDRSQAYALAMRVEVFGTVLTPFGENCRYDFVVDHGGRFIRVQCKTGRLKDGSVRFPTCSSYYHHPALVRGEKYAGQRNYRGEADVFAVYCPENGAVYLVPVEEVGERAGAASRQVVEMSPSLSSSVKHSLRAAA